MSLGRTNEEAAYAPFLCGQRVHDLVAPAHRLFVGLVHVVDSDRQNRVFGCGGISCQQLHNSPGRGDVASYPVQPQILLLKPR